MNLVARFGGLRPGTLIPFDNVLNRRDFRLIQINTPNSCEGRNLGKNKEPNSFTAAHKKQCLDRAAWPLVQIFEVNNPKNPYQFESYRKVL